MEPRRPLDQLELDRLDRILAGETDAPPAVDPRVAAARDVLRTWVPEHATWDASIMLERLRDSLRAEPGAGMAEAADGDERKLRSGVAAAIPTNQRIRPLLLGIPALQSGTFSSHTLRRWPAWQKAISIISICVLAIAALSVERLYEHIGARSYTSAVGQRITVILTDGSRVYLAPGSRLQTVSDFGRTLRAVKLTGEAFFEVTNAHTPFIVRTRTITTRVLGTRFVVRQYAADSALHIAVLAGRVMTGGARNPAVLAAGEMAFITDSTVDVTAIRDTMSYAEWTHGVLAFDDTPVADALTTLERWYGVRFRVADPSLARVRFSGRLDFRSQEAMLTTLKSLLDVTLTYEQHGAIRFIVLHPASGRPLRVPNRTGRREPITNDINKEVGR